MEVNKWALIAVIVAVLGVIASFYPIYMKTMPIQNQNNTAPHIFIEINQDIQTKKTLFTTTNTGGEPATNILLMIDSADKIITVSNKISTADILLPKFDNFSLKKNMLKPINGKSLEVYIPKLMHGSGSLAQIEITGTSASDDKSGNVKAFAIYDQGSAAGRERPTPSDLLHNVFSDPVIIVYYSVLYLAIIIFYYYYIRKWRRKRFIDNLLSKANEVRDKIISSNKRTDECFTCFMPSQTENDQIFIRDEYTKNRLRNFYEKLAERENRIAHYHQLAKGDQHNIVGKEDELIKLNEESLKYAEDIILRTDIRKYE